MLENARRKARAGLERWAGAFAANRSQAPPASLVLGVDTDVALAGRLLGKARDEAGARERLVALSGSAHEVLSGVCVIEAGPGGRAADERAGVARTDVVFRDLGELDIARYLASGEWRDRAGAYAIQGLGSSLVGSLHGDLSNVIGLPVPLLLQLAPNLGAVDSAGENPQANN